MKKRFFSIVLLLAFSFATFSQPANYYDNATGKTGAVLKTALYNIIKGHTAAMATGALYGAYPTTDNIVISGNNKVYDMYSIKANGTADYYYSHQTLTCGNYSSEGDCYNREHSMPQSWFNSSSPMVSDLFHVYPTDGKVNGMRSNYPFGKVISATYTSSNGSKLGSSDPATGYSGKVFEPIDEYKGDFARTYFYMATRYENVIASWASNGSAGEILNGTAYPVFKDWYLNLMIQWHNQDPVSAKETVRNNAVYAIQNNRNPYIDHPEYVASVWGETLQLAFTSSAVISAVQSTAYGYNISAQGPSGATLTITCPTKPAWLTYSNTTPGHATLTGTPSASNLGENHVILSLTDGTTTVQQDFMITVIAALPLGFSSSPVTSVIQGIQYVYNITAQGPSGTTYTITCPTKSAWLTYQNISNGVARLSGTPAIADIGDHEIILAVFDGTSTVNQAFTITVAENIIVPGGTETFELIPAASSSYSDRAWTGDNGISWTATTARTDETINIKAICLKNAGTPYVISGTISGGCSQLSFKHQQKYTGSGGTVTVFINNQQVGSPVSVSTAVQTALFNGFNYTGGFTIKLVSNGFSRIAIDDLSWMGATSAVNVLPSITNVNNSPLNPTTGQPVTISATITDSDGTIQEAYVNWGTTSGSLTSRADMTLVSDKYETVIPAQSQAGTIYYTISAKDNSEGVTTTIPSSYFVTASSNALPTITNIVLNPTSPITGQAVTISAAITDSDGIQEAYLKWGTTSGSLANRVDMTIVSGKYEAVIPAQLQVGIVYYTINAKDILDGVTTTVQLSYAVANALPSITSLAINPQSPTTGQSVTVSATITDSDGAIQEAFINWGTSSGSLPNKVTMVLNGSKYEGVIPSQPLVGTVYYTVNAKDNLEGVTTTVQSSYAVANALPSITSISLNPLNPTTGQSVTVSATISDSDGTIQEAYINWGTSSGSLPNKVNMALNGSKYEGVIPSQPQVVTVYYTVNVKDNLEGVTTTVQSSYAVANALPSITSISINPQNPTTGQTVTVSATISDSDGTIQEAFINWGTSASSLLNKVNMVLNGSKYEGVIPSQSLVGTIYYTVNAKDNSGGVTTTVQLNYAVANSLPSITSIAINPQNPTTGQTVTVSATISDYDGTIQEAYINWGTSSSSLPYRVIMALNGSKYEGVIPPQSQVGIVYYIIIARDNSNGVSTILSNYPVSPSTYDSYEVNNSLVKVFPNPTKGNINIEMSGVKADYLIVSNLIGERVIDIPLNSEKLSLDISRLRPGIYFVTITGNGLRNTTKIVVY